MTKWLSHRMVERGIIKEEEQELYQFGIRNGMILLLNEMCIRDRSWIVRMQVQK